MGARMPCVPMATSAVCCLTAIMLSIGIASAQPVTLSITERDRTLHVAGARVGIEVVLEGAGWQAMPRPAGAIRIGTPARPDRDCLIALPAAPPLGCLWSIDEPGLYPLVAAYSGDSTYPPATSMQVIQEVVSLSLPEIVSEPAQTFGSRDATQASGAPVVSADGRHVAYLGRDPRLSDAEPGNGFDQAMILDRQDGRARRLSTAPTGEPANSDVTRVVISGNGGVVLFATRASNLDPSDDAASDDWFSVDRTTGVVQRLAALRGVGSLGLSDASLSDDGRVAAFASPRDDLVPSDSNGAMDIFTLDLPTGEIRLVSRTSTGASANGASFSPAIAADGTAVAFHSTASNLVPGTPPGVIGVYVAATGSGSVERASIDAAGAPVDSILNGVALSGDGRFVAFVASGNLVPGDSDGRSDVFIRDRAYATTVLASPDPASGPIGPVEQPSISYDGRRIAFLDGSSRRIYVMDAQSQSVSAVGGDVAPSPALGPREARLSGDGMTVVFDSASELLVVGDRNRKHDVFATDLETAAVARISGIRMTGAAAGPAFDAAVSANGVVVAFSALAGNMVDGDANGGLDVFVRDRAARITTAASITLAGTPSDVPASFGPVGLSADGRHVAFASPAAGIVPEDVDAAADVFVHDRVSRSTVRASVSSGGTPASFGAGQPAISGDGRWVAFVSKSPFLVDPPFGGSDNVFLRDMVAGQTRAVAGPGPGVTSSSISTRPRLSGDGRILVFTSNRPDLVAGDTNGRLDVFAYDRMDGSIRRVSVSAAGQQANGASDYPDVSIDGRVVVFASAASNLVPGDNNGRADIFVANLDTGAVERASLGSGGAQATDGDTGLWRPAISGDGRFVLFDSTASVFGAQQAGVRSLIVRDRVSGTVRNALTALTAAPTIEGPAAISADGRTIVVSTTGRALPGSARHASDVIAIANPIDPNVLFGDGFEAP